VGKWLNSLPSWTFGIVVAIILLAKAIVVWRIDILREVSAAFPQSQGFGSSNFVGIAIFTLVGESPLLYGAVSMGALAAAALVLARTGARGHSDRALRRTFVIFAVSWPLLLADLAWLGNGFEFLPLFVAIAVAARNQALAIVGAVLAALTHPEQSFFAFGSLLILTFAPEFRFLRWRAAAGAAIAAAVAVATTLWLTTSGSQSRTTFFFDWITDSLALFVRNAALIVYSGWGVWWLLLILVFVSLSIRGRVLMLVSALGLPLLITATTIDGTRVFTGVASAVAVALIVVLARQLSEPRPELNTDQPIHSGFLGLAFLALLVLPNIQVVMWGELPSAGAFWIDLIR